MINSQEAKSKEHKKQHLLPHGEPDPKNDGHGQQVCQKVGDDVQIRRRPPNGFGMAVRVLLELKIPKGLQGYASGDDDKENKGLVDHDKDEEAFGRVPDPGVVPDAVVQEQDGHLRAPEAELVEENRVPGGLKRIYVLAAGKA